MATLFEVTVPVTKFLSNLEDVGFESEVLFGERVEWVADAGEYIQCRFAHWPREGYVLHRHLRKVPEGRFSGAPTHWVAVPMAIAHEAPTFKRPSMSNFTLYMHSRVRVLQGAETPEGQMLYVEGAGWFFADQLKRIGDCYTDRVDVMRMFIGMPYVWGGRAFPDCSGIILQAELACGGKPLSHSCLAIMNEWGEEVQKGSFRFHYQYGDLVFWDEIPAKSRHVVMMTGSDTCIGASIAYPRMTLEEPFADAVAKQLRDGNGKPSRVRRLAR